MSEPVPAELAAIRARRHPLLVVVGWGWFALLGYFAATPFHAIARHAYGRHPRADSVLFEAGAYDLLELALKSEGALPAAVAAAMALLVLVSLAGHVPLAMAMTQLAFREEGRRRWLPLRTLAARALEVFLRFLGVWVLALLAKGVLVTLGIWLGSVLARNRAEAWGWARAEQAGLVVVALFAIGATAIHVTEDLARAEIITTDARFASAWTRALAVMTARRGAPVLAWAWRALVGGVAVVVVLVLVPMFPVGVAGTLLALLAHQLAVGLRVALRASWLCFALRGARARAPAEVEISPQ